MVRHVLDLRRLRYFQAIAREGSMSGAARFLNVTQPALTHLMNDLEASLRLILFIRSPRGIKLTKAGNLLLDSANRILMEVEFTERKMNSLAAVHQPRPSLRLALISSLAPQIMDSVLLAAARDMPDVLLEVMSMRTGVSREFMAKGEIDLAVVSPDGELTDGIVLARAPYFLVSKADEHFTERSWVDVKDLDKEPLIVPARKLDRTFVEELAREAGIELNIVAEVTGIASRKQAVMAGVGATLLPYHAVAQECANGTLRAIPVGRPPKGRLIALECRPGLDIEDAIFLSLRDILTNVIQPFLGDQLSPP
jgi:LysR family nitrogen assimilation transcriptional regulator